MKSAAAGLFFYGLHSTGLPFSSMSGGGISRPFTTRTTFGLSGKYPLL